MKRFFINLIQEDIDKANKELVDDIATGCPVAQCLLRIIPGARTVASGVRSSEVRFRYLGSKTILYHSKNLSKQIREWDHNKGFTPGRYGLTRE